MRDLKLVLKRQWYEMIEAGKKLEEYREATPFWGKRLTDLMNGHLLFSHRNGYVPIPFKHFESVTFYLGYAKDRPSMTFEIKDMTYDEGYPQWGAEPGKKYFIIKLGKRLV